MPSPTHSRQLRTKLRLAEPCLLQVSDRFWTYPRLPRIFPEFLFMMHSIIRSSVGLIGAAAESAGRRADSEPACRALASYYKTHAVEETHHDDWLLDDMIAIGMDRAQILSRLPSPAVAELVGAQYYWAMHAHPVSLLGYLAVLEGNPSSLMELDAIRKKHALPPAGLRTMIKHARLDPLHRDEIYAVLDDFPLTQQLAELVALSAFHTLDHLGLALQEILDSHRGRRGANARLARAV